MLSSAAAPLYLLTLPADDIITASRNNLVKWALRLNEFFAANFRIASEHENVRTAVAKQKLMLEQLGRIDSGKSDLSSFRRAHSRTISSSHHSPVSFKLTNGESTATANNDESSESRSKNLRTPPGKFESAASDYDVTSNYSRTFSMNIGCSLPSDDVIGGQSSKTSVHRRKTPDSEILDQVMNDLQGRSRYWNTTREPFQALAQQTSFPVRQGADLSSGAQNVDDQATRSLSLQKTSFQARWSTVTKTVTTSPPPERDKILAKSTKFFQMKSGDTDPESGSTAVALSSPRNEYRRFSHSFHHKSATLSRWMDVTPAAAFMKLRKEEIIRTLLARKESRMINHAEGYLKLACAQRDNRSILGIIDVLQVFEQSQKWPFYMTCTQSDVLLDVKDENRQVRHLDGYRLQIRRLEFAAHPLHHLRQAIHNNLDVSSTTLISQGKLNLESLELLPSLAKIAISALQLDLGKQLEKQHRVRPLKPGDHVALYPPESTFASGTYPEDRVLLPKIWGAAWICKSSGSARTLQRTHQKYQPTGSISSASTSLSAKAASTRRSTSELLNHRSTTLGPNPALEDLFSKTRKMLLEQSLQGFAKRPACFPDINRKCRAAHLFADWTCRLH